MCVPLGDGIQFGVVVFVGISDGTFPYSLPYNNRYRITVTDINYFKGAKK